MHDPLVVAFVIRAPWRHKFRGVLAGRSYRPVLVTVWHKEPGGHDSGDVCRHYRYGEGADGVSSAKPVNGWRFHVWHWRIQVHPLRDLRRWALTRCTWCGGPSRKGDYVNFSHSWDGPRGRWWQGERGLYHADCSAVESARRLCFCTVPVLDCGDFGQCEVCGRFRAWRQEPGEEDRLLASLPRGSRITPDVRQRVEAAQAAGENADGVVG